MTGTETLDCWMLRELDLATSAADSEDAAVGVRVSLLVAGKEHVERRATSNEWAGV